MKLLKAPPQQAVFWLILILALLVRLWGIGFSLPFIYHVDEERFASISLNYLRGDLNPHFFHVPSLYTYSVAAIWKIYYFVGKVFGIFQTNAEFISSFNRNPTVFIILGRLLTILLSIATVLVVYQAGKKMSGVRAGAIAALLLIFSPEHNKISHYMVPDSPMVLFLVFSFYFIWRIYEEGKLKFYILSGLCAGLAFTTKYGGHFLVLPLLLAHIFRFQEDKRPWKNWIFHWGLVLWAMAFLAVFFAGTPYALLDFKIFWNDFRWQSAHLFSLGHFGSSTAQPAWLFYFQYGFAENVGLLAQFLVYAGIIYGLFRHRKRDILLFSFPLVLFILMGTWKTRAIRYLLPLAPFFILIAASFLEVFLDALERLLAKQKAPVFSKAKALAPALIILIFLSLSIFKVVRYDYTLTQEDTRTVAKHWIEANIPQGTKIALESYCPQISRKKFRVTYRHSLSQVDLEWLARRKIKYVVVSDIMFARFTRFPKEFPQQAAFYNSLDREAILIKTFAPRRDEPLLDMHNPTLKIYKLSSYPNFSFPGNFAQYSQTVSLYRLEGEKWLLQSSLWGETLKARDEKIKNPYVRIINAQEKELTKLLLHQGEIPSSQTVSFFGSQNIYALPAGAKIFIGYEFEYFPNPPPFVPEAPLKKEYPLAENIKSGSLSKERLDYVFASISFPNSQGDDYIQTLALHPAEKEWILSSTIFGGELRWGDDYVINPFVRITDFQAREIARLTLFEGTVGSLDAKMRGPLTKSFSLPDFPPGARIFVGYDSYFDKESPNLAGGPQIIELKIPAQGLR